MAEAPSSEWPRSFDLARSLLEDLTGGATQATLDVEVCGTNDVCWLKNIEEMKEGCTQQLGDLHRR